MQLFTLCSFYFFCVYASHRDWTTRNEMCKHRSLSFVFVVPLVSFHFGGLCQHIKSKIASSLLRKLRSERGRIVNMISVPLNGTAIWHLHLPMQHKSYSLFYSVWQGCVKWGDKYEYINLSTDNIQNISITFYFFTVLLKIIYIICMLIIMTFDHWKLLKKVY